MSRKPSSFLQDLLRPVSEDRPLPPAQRVPYLACFVYREDVHGAPRRFSHETYLTARDEPEAWRRALAHFDAASRETGSGWTRRLLYLEVRRVSGDGRAPRVARLPDLDR